MSDQYSNIDPVTGAPTDTTADTSTDTGAVVNPDATSTSSTPATDESTLVSTPAEPSPEATADTEATKDDDDPDNLKDGITRYEGTISKVNKDGDVVLSDHIGPGEKRVSDTPESKNA